MLQLISYTNFLIFCLILIVTHDGVVTHLEPDIPECEVKWALGPQTKLVEVIEFQLNYLKILKDASAKSAALNMSANLENSAMTTGLEKVSFHSNPKEGKWQRKFKLAYDCTHFTC